MKNKTYNIKVFDGEKEVANYEGVENAIAFGTKEDPEDAEKIKIFVYHGDSVSNQGIFLLTRALLNSYDDALAAILMACSSHCALDDDFTEIEGEIEEEEGEDTDDSWDK